MHIVGKEIEHDKGIDETAFQDLGVINSKPKISVNLSVVIFFVHR